ncbi:BsuBI/PstI family type II restriction endonuclease [Sediminibacterium sp.]|uniref:BsuBI/PstI family type II restriction endonuclease n=1 Tax=Sediminibacterium sp. TaxID=1917865 RepID=UPI003F7271B5
MKKVKEALKLLKELGLPLKQQNERSALALLAFANLKVNSNWSDATQISMSVVGSKDGKGKYPGIMQFINQNYSKVKKYKENSRESFRDETVKPFVQAGICEHNPEEPGLSPNSKNNHYRLTLEVLKVIRSVGSANFETELSEYKKEVGTLSEKYAKARNLLKIPIKLSSGEEFEFAPGVHNQLQAAIIKDFASVFAQGSVVVYLGDTSDKDSHMDKKLLAKLKIPIAIDTKLPDIILYDQKKDWLFLIEAVTSVGPMSPQRIIDLEKMLANCKSGKVYVTAFPDRSVFRSHMADIAWETEVWIADNPTHMIHFNGDRFMGPR